MTTLIGSEDGGEANASLVTLVERYRPLIEVLPEAVMIIDTAQRFVLVNRRAAQVFGFSSPDEMLATSALSLVHEAEISRALENSRKRSRGELSPTNYLRYLLRRADGSMFPGELTSAPLRDPGGRILANIVITRDITAHAAALGEAHRVLKQYTSLIDTSPDGILLIDLQCNVIAANRQMAELHGYSSPGEIVGLNAEQLYDETFRPQAEVFAKRLKSDDVVRNTECTLKRRDGSQIPAEFSASVVRNELGEIAAYTVVVRDIRERKQAEAEMQYLALHDVLTTLPNRRLFKDRLRHALQVAQRQQETVAVVLLDCDNFKEVNDILGHHTGDVVLQEIARRLRSVVRESDTVARLGGDEFAIVFDATDPEGAEQAVQKLSRAVRQPLQLDNHRITIGASIGVAIFPRDAEDDEGLLRCADVAMYSAKEAALPYRRFQPQMVPARIGRLRLSSELRSAITDGGLSLSYQPKVRSKDFAARHVEALIRWRHEELGLLLPEHFLDLAETTGAIHDLTLWVLEEAIHQAALWRAGGLTVTMSVNLSARDLMDQDLAARVEDILRRCDLPAEQLQVEASERVLMEEPLRAQVAIDGLARLGVGSVIDDFGTGYCSLVHLRSLPICRIEVDRSLARNIRQGDGDLAVLHSAVDIGRDLGLEVLAEGVETQAEVEAMCALGVDMLQGDAFSAPLEPDAYVNWLTAWERISH